MRTTALLSIASFFLTASVAHAQTGEVLPVDVPGTGTAVITVEQVQAAEGIFAKWTLIQPGNVRAEMSKKTHTFENLSAGTYTIAGTPPEGATGKVKITINGTVVHDKDIPQLTFAIAEGDIVHVQVIFTFTRTGIVSVGSNIPGLSFTLQGPNRSSEKGVTPAAYMDVAEGLYTATFDPIDGCIMPKPKSDRLVKGGRVNISITLVCDALKEHAAGQQQQKLLEFVSVLVEDQTVIFTDAPLNHWYSQYVHTAAKTGIMSGYKNDDGTFTGEYGISNNVTIAELLKIAHKLAGIDESKIRPQPINPRARETWFASFYTSAENRSWLITLDPSLDPARPATRAEVVTTLLQALDVPRLWPKGKLFSDISPVTPHADAIETAAADGLVSGSDDPARPGMQMFRPDDLVNRAEMAKIISLGMDIYREKTAEMTGDSW